MAAPRCAAQVHLPVYSHYTDVSLLLARKQLGSWRVRGRARVRLYGLLPLLLRGSAGKGARVTIWG
jgi:hypothetical protein